MKIGIDKISIQPNLIKNFGRIGLVVNQASTTSGYIPTVEVIANACQKTSNASLKALFGPQHGYAQTEQDNMKETDDTFFELGNLHLPVFSLYSKTREPLEAHLHHVDTLVVDLQDIGCRVYTYMLTLAGCLRSAAKYKKRVIVLDRPNPLGLCYQHKKRWMRVEGNCLDTRWKSFVSMYSIPIRHGLTLGELGSLFIKNDKLDIEYSVIKVAGLKRSTALSVLQKANWVMPSPNIPTWKSAYFFPAFVSLEGTNVSEGRGTTIPFELIGAPWLNVPKCIKFLKEHENLYSNPADLGAKSIIFREHHFRPTFNKYAGQECHGIHFGLLKPENINIFALGMCFLYFCNLFHKNDFQWSKQEYEYNFSDMPIHLILGSDEWQKMFTNTSKNCDNLKNMLAASTQDAQNFIHKNQDILLYE